MHTSNGEEKMINRNGYFTSYADNDDKLDFLRHGLLNEFGVDVNSNSKDIYVIDNIIKKKCKIREK